MLTVHEKVVKYLEEHKTPTQAAKIAKHYIISESAVGAVLRELLAANKVTLRKQGTKKFYQMI